MKRSGRSWGGELCQRDNATCAQFFGGAVCVIALPPPAGARAGCSLRKNHPAAKATIAAPMSMPRISRVISISCPALFCRSECSGLPSGEVTTIAGTMPQHGIVTLALVSHFWPLREPAKSLEMLQRHETKRSELGGVNSANVTMPPVLNSSAVPSA